MNEEKNDKPEDTSPDDERQGPIGGERLAAARRAQQITVLEIAKELHLDETKVRALECNDFEVIGAPVFAKGHLRKYAQLVQVDEADLMLDYYRLNRSAGMPPVVSTRPKLRSEPSLGPWLVAIAIVIIVVTVFWWFAGRSSAVPERSPSLDISLSPQQNVAITPTPAAFSEAVSETVIAATDTQMHMTVSYSGDCWTEITDATGRRLFFEMGTAGRTLELSGEAPFDVLFGNAGNVRVAVNGVDYSIVTAERSGRTLRLTISGS